MREFLLRLQRVFAGKSGDFFVALALQISGAGLAYLSQVALARTAGASGFGLLSLVVSVSAVVGLVITLGMGALGLRLLPAWVRDGEGAMARQFLVLAYALTIALASLVGAGVVAVGASIAWGAATALGVTLLVTVTALVSLGGDFGRGIGAFASAYGAALVLRPAVAMLTLGVLAWAGVAGFGAGLSALVVGGWVAVVVQVGVIRRRLARLGGRGRVGRGNSVGWLRMAPSYMIANLLVLFLLQVDILVCSVVLESRDLGYYSSAVRTLAVISVVSGAIVSVAAPRFALASGDRIQLEREVRIVARWQFALVCGVAVPLFVAAPWVLGLFGSGFASAEWAMRLMVIGQVVNAAFGPSGTVLVYSGFPRVVSGGTLVCVFMAALACFFGASMWGLTGAAGGYATGTVTGGVILWWLARSRVSVDTGVWNRAVSSSD
ncbi:hypothetical protein JK386_00525 [Nocardioides sp. zg-536]|uniref:Oligosaccharide flippase family protein n=1 Tax=Nocardioides faecalis TaxID=2803858 RepID=A0A939BWG6_9ACTN|nr:hypothetical protein [Nocardioides faecalis]MBM9458383.1 hypothetical protein [Nocardioides faecalis]QVI58402.1 hypothetical protein KG111_15605 [Nocardioides faecalis]